MIVFVFIFLICIPLIGLRWNLLGMRNILIYIISHIQGNNVKIINNNSSFLCEKILSLNNKGNYLEKHFACPMWFPMYSVESVDGELWIQMRKWTDNILKLSEWKQYTLDAVNNVKLDLIITSKELSFYTIEIMWYLLFHTNIDTQMKQLLYQSGNIWRKRVSQKDGGSKADMEILNKTIQEMDKYIQHSIYNTLYVGGELRIPFISCFLQPFIISPQINFTDICAEMYPYLVKHKEQLNKEQVNISYFIKETIRLHHPFPLFERYNEETNTQYFIEMDNFKQTIDFCPYLWKNTVYKREHQWKLFGYGKRGCVGQQLAMQVLSHLIEKILTLRTLDAFKPQTYHTISGRRNDKKIHLFLFIRIFQVLKNIIYIKFSRYV